MTEALIVVGLSALTVAGFCVAVAAGFGVFGLGCLAVAGARMRRGAK